MNNIAIFASGSGTNAENLINYFRTSKFGRVKIVFSNRENAGVIPRAKKLGVEVISFNREQFYNSDLVLNQLFEREIDFIVLAGFLWLVPDKLVNSFENRIVNIHPALLPAYGGKGMYGDYVHRAVIANEEKESGITIHYVNHAYDEGSIIRQERCRVDEGDTPGTLAYRIHELEYKYYPLAVEELLKQI